MSVENQEAWKKNPGGRVTIRFVNGEIIAFLDEIDALRFIEARQPVLIVAIQLNAEDKSTLAPPP